MENLSAPGYCDVWTNDPYFCMDRLFSIQLFTSHRSNGGNLTLHIHVVRIDIRLCRRFTQYGKDEEQNQSACLVNASCNTIRKILFRWLASTVVFIITFIIAFKLADYTRVLIYSATCPDNTIVAAKLKYIFAVSGDYAFLSQISCKIKGVFIINYFLLQSCFILGSSIWPKNSLIKTFASGFSILTLYSLIFTGIARLMFKDAAGNMIGDSDPQSFTITLAYVMSTFFIFLNWGLAYFRFKEAEIINRL